MIHYTPEHTLEKCGAIAGQTVHSCSEEIEEVDCVACVRAALCRTKGLADACVGVLSRIDPEGHWR